MGLYFKTLQKTIKNKNILKISFYTIMQCFRKACFFEFKIITKHKQNSNNMFEMVVSIQKFLGACLY